MSKVYHIDPKNRTPFDSKNSDYKATVLQIAYACKALGREQVSLAEAVWALKNKDLPVSRKSLEESCQVCVSRKLLYLKNGDYGLTIAGIGFGNPSSNSNAFFVNCSGTITSQRAKTDKLTRLAVGTANPRNYPQYA